MSLVLGSLERILCVIFPRARDWMARIKSFSGMSVSLRISCNGEVQSHVRSVNSEPSLRCFGWLIWPTFLCQWTLRTCRQLNIQPQFETRQGTERTYKFLVTRSEDGLLPLSAGYGFLLIISYRVEVQKCMGILAKFAVQLPSTSPDTIVDEGRMTLRRWFLSWLTAAKDSFLLTS